jgi:succinyldiaminopimelate transaminase
VTDALREELEAPVESGFHPPVYPFDRLDDAKAKAEAHEGGIVDLSIGTPFDPPAPSVLSALAGSGAERGYPSSKGGPAFREAAATWIGRRFGIDVPASAVAVCVGTKEFVAGLPQWLSLRSPGRDTVLYPSLSYPTYEMGAVLARCRAVPVPVRSDGRLDLAAIKEEDARRGLVLWVNSPSNPTGGVDDLQAAAAWGRRWDVPVFSDECYVEYTWKGPPRTVLEDGLEGVVAVHSLSKRSNMAGLRAGFYAGDPALVTYLSEVRQHAGFMVPGPVQAAAVAALGDEAHVEVQRARYLERLERFASVLRRLGASCELPAGGFYLWSEVPDAEREGSAWSFTDHVAEQGGALIAPGDLFGPDGAGHVRVAMVQPLERLQLVERRLGLG